MELPYTAESIGKVLPSQEWQLVQDQTGRLTSVIRDHKTGAAKQIDAYQFEQGDFSGMQIDLPAGAYVQAGDTIVRMYSTRQSQEIQELEAQLSLYAAQLTAETTGDKPPIVQEAENKLNFSVQDLTLKESLYHTKKRLKEEGLIAVTEFQTAENDYQLAKIQVEIARKTLETVGTGLKNESVGITEAQLRGLRARLALLRQKGLSFVLRAPFSGYVVPNTLPEELLILHSSNEYLVHIPMKVEQMQYMNDSTRIQVTDVKTQRVFEAKAFGSLPKIEVLDNRQVALLTAAVTPDSAGIRLSTGISARCMVDFGKLNQREYLKRILNFK
jgi:multidrug efflux pump subunit AcrA (membrane-fusion protein)